MELPGMISVEEARDRILSYFKVLEPENRPLLDCLGQVLAEDIVSEINIPPLSNAAMDGYAVRATDTAGAGETSPCILKVIEELPAGYIATKEVVPGTAIRIMTGAPIPRGADAVVQFEDTDEERRKEINRDIISEVTIYKEASIGVNIREAGEDVRKGDLVLSRGTVLRPAEIGVLASLGKKVVSVIRRPIIAILATGDELAEVGEPLEEGKIYNSNTYSVATLTLKYGGIPRLLGIAKDTRESLVTKIHEALDADMLVTSGGVSMGDYDIVKDVLAEQGEMNFWTVRMKPGKPLAFGVLGRSEKRVPHLGLPGNPVSSMVAFEQFVRPAILKMLGKVKLAKPNVLAVLEDGAANRDGRRVFLRAIMEKKNGQYHARLTGPQGSGILTSMSAANGLAIIPENVPAVRKGDIVEVQMLDWPEED